MKSTFRHTVVIILSLILTYLFFLSRSEWHPMHAWNRAFADTSLVLLVVIIAMGPLSRLVQSIRPLLQWRRELGIWAAVTALIHIYIILDGWVMWDFILLFKVPI